MLKVRGPGVPVEQMGRIIDPYLVEDKGEPGKWWCFFDDNAANMSFSYDLETWTYFNCIPAGENVCILTADRDDCLMFHSPKKRHRHEALARLEELGRCRPADHARPTGLALGTRPHHGRVCARSTQRPGGRQIPDVFSRHRPRGRKRHLQHPRLPRYRLERRPRNLGMAGKAGVAAEDTKAAAAGPLRRKVVASSENSLSSVRWTTI